jgi:hypothetical protein
MQGLPWLINIVAADGKAARPTRVMITNDEKKANPA